MKRYLIKLDAYLGVLDARVVQFDQLNSGTCELEFELTSNREVVNLTDKRATVLIKCPSGSVIEDTIQITDVLTGKAECTLANDMITEVGMHYGELCIYSTDNTELFTTSNFRYSVSQQMGEAGVKVDTRYSTLQELIFEVETLKDKGVIDIAKVEELLVEATTVNAESKSVKDDVTIKHGEVSVDHSDVVLKHSEVLQNAGRTESNAQQVSADKGVVTRFKNDVIEVAGIVTENKDVVEQAKADTLQARDITEGYRDEVQQLKADVQELSATTIGNIISEGEKQVNLAKAEVANATEQANIARQKAQEIASDADQINRNKQEIVDSIPNGSKRGQLFFIRKG